MGAVRAQQTEAMAARDEGLVIPGIAPDGTLFPIGKMDAHRRGQLHLAVSVFVFAGDALLIQRRALGKYHCGGLWANTCCTHPHFGESPADCAARRLREELGLSLDLDAGGIVDYRADVGQGLTEHERVHVFRGEMPLAQPVQSYDPDEVMAVAWVRPAELRLQVAQDPARFTPWIRIYLERWPELSL